MDHTVMWPVRHDMTRDESRKCLRCLELDAYGSMVSVLRAQGPFNTDKQKLLQELAKVLHISNERHRAEVRRAVSDEKLAMIAEQLYGPNTGTDWAIEGRRTIPLIPRLKARNAFSALANSLSLAAATANDNYPVRVNDEVKDVTSDTETHFKLEKKLPLDTEQPFPTQVTRNCRKRPLCDVDELSDTSKSEEQENVETEQDAKQYASQRQESSSPLSALHNKVLVLSSNSLEALNHDILDETSPESKSGQSSKNPGKHQNVTIIPLAVTCVGSNSIVSHTDAQFHENLNTVTPAHSDVHASNTISVYTNNSTKHKVKSITYPNKVNTKGTSEPVVISNCVSHVTESNDQKSENSDALSHSNTRTKSDHANNSCIKRVSSIIQTNVKPVQSTKSVVSSQGQRVMSVCPGITVSSGPGPPHVKQMITTLACKKLPVTMISHQSTAKMGVTQNCNKTVNISHHPNKKLTTKTNVIVIQKGHNKGIMLSHAGKEVLGKVIMGGKKVSVKSQQNTNAVNILPHHIALNNGNQVSSLLSTTNLPHMESVKSNIKSGNAIVFNLRQDILEKNNVFSQLLEPSAILASETDNKTVIRSTSTHLSEEEDNNGAQLIDTETPLKTDDLATTVMEENLHRKTKDVCKNVNSKVINSVDPTKFMEREEILLNSSQLTSIQDNPINIVHTEDSICNSEVDMFETGLQSTDINFENFQYLVEDSENHILTGRRSPILTISHIKNFNDS